MFKSRQEKVKTDKIKIISKSQKVERKKSSKYKVKCKRKT